MKLQIITLAAIVAVVAAQAQTSAVPPAIAAQVQTNAASAVFQSADTNGDNRVSQAEFAEYVKKTTFEKLDANKDNVISPEEWKAVDLSPEAQKHFEALDKDRNGRITYQEFSGSAHWKNTLNNSFTSLDRDRDSNLSPSELPRLPMFRLLSVNF